MSHLRNTTTKENADYIADKLLSKLNYPVSVTTDRTSDGDFHTVELKNGPTVLDEVITALANEGWLDDVSPSVDYERDTVSISQLKDDVALKPKKVAPEAAPKRSRRKA